MISLPLSVHTEEDAHSVSFRTFLFFCVWVDGPSSSFLTFHFKTLLQKFSPEAVWGSDICTLVCFLGMFLSGLAFLLAFFVLPSDPFRRCTLLCCAAVVLHKWENTLKLQFDVNCSQLTNCLKVLIISQYRHRSQILYQVRETSQQHKTNYELILN